MTNSASTNATEAAPQFALLLDQTTIDVDASAFEKIVDWINSPPTEAEVAGMRRLRAAKALWSRV